MSVHADSLTNPILAALASKHMVNMGIQECTFQQSCRVPLCLENELVHRTIEEIIGTITFYHYRLCKPRDIICFWEGIQYSPDVDEMRNMSHEKLLLQLKEYQKLDKVIKETAPVHPRIVYQRRKEAISERTRIAIENHPHLNPILFGP